VQLGPLNGARDAAYKPGYGGLSGEGVEVIVIDSGCDLAHQEFAHLTKTVSLVNQWDEDPIPCWDN
jgi:subtilisin family serine protease